MIPSLGFCFCGGRSAKSARLSALYAKHIPGGVFTYYFVKGSKGYCVPACAGSNLVTVSNMCAYIGSKLQDKSDCTVGVDVTSAPVILFPNDSLPMSHELVEMKELSQQKRVRVLVKVLRKHDAKTLDIGQSDRVWGLCAWQQFLRWACRVSDEGLLTTAWPVCPLRVAYMIDRGTNVTVRYKDMYEFVKDPPRVPPFVSEMRKAFIPGATTSASKITSPQKALEGVVIRPRCAHGEVEIVTPVDDSVRLVKYFLEDAKPKASSVFTQVDFILSTHEYAFEHLDKMLRLSKGQKQFLILDIYPDPIPEEHHEAAAKVQTFWRMFVARRRFVQQVLVLNEEHQLRFSILVDIDSAYADLRREMYYDHVRILELLEEQKRLLILDQEQYVYFPLGVQCVHKGEQILRMSLMIQEGRESVVFFEQMFRFQVAAYEAWSFAVYQRLARVAYRQVFERYYIELEQFQRMLHIKNSLTAFRTKIKLHPPLKPIDTSSAAQLRAMAGMEKVVGASPTPPLVALPQANASPSIPPSPRRVLFVVHPSEVEDPEAFTAEQKTYMINQIHEVLLDDDARLIDHAALALAALGSPMMPSQASFSSTLSKTLFSSTTSFMVPRPKPSAFRDLAATITQKGKGTVSKKKKK